MRDVAVGAWTWRYGDVGFFPRYAALFPLFDRIQSVGCRFAGGLGGVALPVMERDAEKIPVAEVGRAFALRVAVADVRGDTGQSGERRGGALRHVDSRAGGFRPARLLYHEANLIRLLKRTPL